MDSPNFRGVKNEPLQRMGVFLRGSNRPVGGTVGGRKQLYPQPIDMRSVEDDDISCNSEDSEDEIMSASFMLKNQPTMTMSSRCDKCGQPVTSSEFSLVTQDRKTKQFCSENCQDLFKEEILRQNACEWCKKKYPLTTTLIVMEPSTQSVPVQFCTSTCVNKYKMDLFCHEVKEQLKRIKEENIQLQNMSSDCTGKRERRILITPELWSEGESAVVYVNEPNIDSLLDSNNNNSRTNTSYVSGSNYSSNSNIRRSSGHRDKINYSERKRKGYSMETVISKISRHNYSNNYDYPTNDHNPTYNGKTNQPMNLSINQSVDDKDLRHRDISQQQTSPSCVNENTKRTEKTTPPSGFIPIPVLIPLPIPVPIPIGSCLSLLGKTNSKEVPDQGRGVQHTAQRAAYTQPNQGAARNIKPQNNASHTRLSSLHYTRRSYTEDEPE